MNSLIEINKVKVEFELSKNEVFINSFQLAEVFEKKHKSVLEKIKQYPEDDFFKKNFIVKYKEIQKGVIKQKTPYYNLTKDGFSLLVMGFTGLKAYEFKKAFIYAFNDLQKRLRDIEPKQQSLMIDYYDEKLKNEKLEKEKIAYHLNLLNADLAKIYTSIQALSAYALNDKYYQNVLLKQ